MVLHPCSLSPFSAGGGLSLRVQPFSAAHPCHLSGEQSPGHHVPQAQEIIQQPVETGHSMGLWICLLDGIKDTDLISKQGRRVIFQKVKEWSLMIMKTVIVAVLLAGVVPLLLGLLFELVIVAPLRVPLDQTPLFYPWQDWALGVLHAKIIAAITLMGPQWWLKTVIEQVYANGIRNIDLQYIVRKLAAPVISVLLLSLCVPYVIASGIVPLLGVTAEMQNLVHRRIYPFLLMVVVLMGILSFQVRQFKRLYEHIKNDKYLVGQRLVNYERKSGKQGTSPPPPQSSQE